MKAREIQNKSAQYCVVYVTTASEQEAKLLSQTLVSEKLAACVNRVGPMVSTYAWQGQIQEDTEYLLVIKARCSDFDLLQARIETLHTYDLPEILALPVLTGSEKYLNWLGQATERTS